MRAIPLTKGKSALVDDADFARLTSMGPWHASEKETGFYAARTEGGRTSKRTIVMARVLLDAPPGVEVDHANGDTLDNRRSNLRLADKRMQQRNSSKRDGWRGRPCSSRFKGVSLDRRRGVWNAYIRLATGRLFLGGFAIERDAALAYDAAATTHFGAFARTNF